MIPRFLQPERWPYASVEVVPAEVIVEQQREDVDAALEALKKLKPAKKPKLRRVPRVEAAS